MPKLLKHRCRVDTISGFRLAAEQRFDDGVSLAATERRTAAIYLWGYVAEMLLKAAYFDSIGYASTRPMTIQDLRFAQASGVQAGIHWTGNFHSLKSWAELVVLNRSPSRMSRQITLNADVLFRLWSETLRYHKNVAYPHEVAQSRHAAEWFLTHAIEL